MSKIKQLREDLEEIIVAKTYSFILENLEDILDELIDLEDIIKSGKAKLVEPVLNEYGDGWFEPYYEIDGENLIENLVGVSSHFEDVIIDYFFKHDSLIADDLDIISSELAHIRDKASDILKENIKEYI